MSSVDQDRGVPAPSSWEAQCLADDPFAGDFGGAGDSDRILSDKMVTARKGGECHTCAEIAQPGTRNRVRTEVYDGELMSFRWCEPCCRLMARAHVDEAAATELESRITLGIQRRAPSHTGAE